jgi:alpha-tubulin suppressor-like RCC1 family protein
MGSHRYGCLGLGKIDTDVNKPMRIPDLVDIVDIAANTNTSYAIDKHGKSFSWGTNYSKQLGQDDEEDYYVPTLVKSKHLDSRENYAVSIGGQHSLLIVSEEKEMDSDAE